MSLDKAIEHHKEYRKNYRGSKAFDMSCRNHGGCEWCLNNRLYQLRRMDQKAKYDLAEYGFYFRIVNFVKCYGGQK